MNQTIIDYAFSQIGLEQSRYGGYEGLLVFITILIASLASAKIIHWLISMYLKNFASRTKSDIDDLVLKTLQKPLYYVIMLIGVEFAIRIIEVPIEVQEVLDIAISVAVVAIGAWLAAALADIIIINWIGKHIAEKTKTTADDEAIPFLSKLTKFVIYIVAFMIILDQFNVEITPLVASLGIAGFAIGFAAKDTLGNLLAGFFILADRPFVKGDRIEINGKLGEVVDIGLRTTRIRTLDYTYIILPNSDIISNEVINYALPDVQLKVKMNIGVAYGTDPQKVKDLLLKIARSVDEVLKDPAPSVYFTEFGDSALNFLLITWVPDFRKKINVIDEINMKINEEFAKEGIDIPFPCRTVYLHQS